MKARIQLVAVLFSVASAGLAMGCGCASERVRLEPVREQIVQTSACPVRQPVLSHRTAYVPECPSCRWVPPSTSNPAYAIGNFVTAPFRFITGRSLGQPDVVRSYTYSEPAAQRVVTTTRAKRHYNKCGQPTGKVTIIKDSMLEPVGERLTTVKVIRTKPMPVAESCPILAEPVAERTIIRSAPLCPSACDF